MQFCSLLGLLTLPPSLSVCCSVSLLRFTFFFHASPFCFSSCPEILAAPAVSSPTTHPTAVCLPPALSVMLWPMKCFGGGGANDLVPGHGSCLHITGCTKHPGFGDFLLSHFNCLRSCSGLRPRGKVQCLCSAGSIPHKLPAKSPAKRMCLCSASEHMPAGNVSN